MKYIKRALILCEKKTLILSNCLIGIVVTTNRTLTQCKMIPHSLDRRHCNDRKMWMDGGGLKPLVVAFLGEALCPTVDVNQVVMVVIMIMIGACFILRVAVYYYL